jgi:sugar/nucleoside kinase (ribokinase family)
VRERREMLGGKGANQAVALAQLGLRAALIAVAGDDETGARLLDQAGRDRIDTSAVVSRAGTATGLIVDNAGRWRYLEHLPPPVLLTETDVRRAARLFDGARWASAQLQQPSAGVLAAAVLARRAGCRVLIDGAPPDGTDRDALLGAVDVVRADAREAKLLTADWVRASGAARPGHRPPPSAPESGTEREVPGACGRLQSRWLTRRGDHALQRRGPIRATLVGSQQRRPVLHREARPEQSGQGPVEISVGGRLRHHVKGHERGDLRL